MKLTTYLQLVPRWRKHGCIHLLPPYVISLEYQCYSISAFIKIVEEFVDSYQSLSPTKTMWRCQIFRNASWSTWKKHIRTKRKQLGIKFSKLYWLIGCRSQLSVYNKVLVYKAKSNIEILERFIARDLSIMTVQAAIGYHSNKYKARMNHHPNSLAQDLMLQSTPCRLKRFIPNDLPTRFLSHMYPGKKHNLF
jgi:hypothetical protein